jgi:hypothetical protein
MTLITTAPRRRRRWGRVRGALAVAALLLSALEALVSAVTGWPPLSALARRAAAPLASAWRSAAYRPFPAGPPVVIRPASVPASEGSPDHGASA